MHRSVYITALLFSSCVVDLWCPSAEMLHVRQGENVTLPCNITARTHIVWYLQSGAVLTLILSTIRGSLNNNVVIINNNKDPPHFQLSIENMSLGIMDIGQYDVGCYYCGTYDINTPLHFEKAVCLALTDVEDGIVGEIALCQKLLLSLGCALAFILLVSLSMICYRRGFCSCITKGSIKEKPGLKVMELQYASLRHLPGTQGREPAPAPPSVYNVTYDTVANVTDIPRA